MLSAACALSFKSIQSKISGVWFVRLLIVSHQYCPYSHWAVAQMQRTKKGWLQAETMSQFSKLCSSCYQSPLQVHYSHHINRRGLKSKKSFRSPIYFAPFKSFKYASNFLSTRCSSQWKKFKYCRKIKTCQFLGIESCKAQAVLWP